MGANTPIEVPLMLRDKTELVRIIELLKEDLCWYVDERNRLIAGAGSPAAPPVSDEHICQTPNYTDGPCYACAKEKLLEWTFERYENCIRLAKDKTGDDRKGWLEDADHFLLTLSILKGPNNLQPNTRTIVNRVIAHLALRHNVYVGQHWEELVAAAERPVAASPSSESPASPTKKEAIQMETGTDSQLLRVVEVQCSTVMEEHLREELRIANSHLEAARKELRELKGNPAAACCESPAMGTEKGCKE